jgi:hypothetical protein
MKLSKIIFLVVLAAAFFTLTAKISLAAETASATCPLISNPVFHEDNKGGYYTHYWTNCKGEVVDLKIPKTFTATLPNFRVNNVNFYYEHGGYYANVVIQNAGVKVIDNLTVNLKYNGQTYSQSIVSDCAYYMCGATFGPLSNVTNANFDVVIDPENHFTESNKADNIYSVKRDLADFTISATKVVKKSGGYYVYATVKNIGQAINGPVVAKGVPYVLAVAVQDNLNNFYFPKTNINELYFPKNFTRQLEFGPLLNVNKIKTLTITVDRTNAVTELNENNNSLTIGLDNKIIRQ